MGKRYPELERALAGLAPDAPRRKLAELPDTPAWAALLLDDIEGETDTFKLFHVAQSLRFCRLILERRPVDTLDGWAASGSVPDWFGEAVIAFGTADSAQERAQVKSDLAFFEREIDAMVWEPLGRRAAMLRPRLPTGERGRMRP